MQTNSLVSLIKRQFPDWSRQFILEFIDEVQKIVFTRKPTRQMRVLDATTGKDPVISVTSASVEYPVSTATGFPADVWRVTNVYSRVITEPEDVICYDATSEEPAKIVFNRPTNGQYHVRAYRFPTALETEDDKLEIPEAYHISHVVNGVSGLIEQFRSGKSDRLDFFLNRQVNEIVNNMSDGRNAVPTHVVPRGY